MDLNQPDNSFEEFMRTKVYDLAARAGSQVYSFRVDKSTIENLIPIFQRESDPINGALLLMAYIMRQTGRGQINGNVGRLMLDNLRNILDNFRNDPEKLRAAIQKYLLLVKWVYEAYERAPRKTVENFDELLKLFISGGRY